MMISNDSRTHILDVVNKGMNTFSLQTHFTFDLFVDRSWKIPKRTIDDWLLTYIAKGCGMYHIDGVDYHVKAGSVILITDGIEHYAGESDGNMHAIGFRFAPYKSGKVDTVEFHKTGYAVLPKNSSDYYDIFRKIIQLEDESHNDIKLYMAHHLIYQIFYTLYQESRTKILAIDRDFSPVTEYIDEHIGKEIEIDVLAKKMQLSRNYFCNQFKKYYGVTLKRFIYQRKMEYAKYMVLETDEKLTDIAFKVGYADQYIFSNQFKRFWSVPPSVLRRVKEH